jgi:hypothetical protein
MLPADMQCRDFIAGRKAQLARLQKPALRVVGGGKSTNGKIK